MARRTTTTDPDLSDDNYVPTTNEQSSIKGRIDALELVLIIAASPVRKVREQRDDNR